MPQGMPSSLAARRAMAKAVSFADAHHFVDQLALENARHEAGADALNAMRAGQAARQHGAVFRLDSDHLQASFTRLQHFADAGDGAAGTDAGNHGIDRAVAVAPDFLGGRMMVRPPDWPGSRTAAGSARRATSFVILSRGSSAPRMPFAAGVSSMVAPSSISILRRSIDMLSGMVRISL